jgi:hypothetical protein
MRFASHFAITFTTDLVVDVAEWMDELEGRMYLIGDLSKAVLTALRA